MENVSLYAGKSKAQRKKCKQSRKEKCGIEQTIKSSTHHSGKLYLLDKFLNKFIQEIDLANLLLKNLQNMCFSRKCLSISHKSKMQKTIYYYV